MEKADPVERLNVLLADMRFYDRWVEKKNNPKVSGDLSDMARHTHEFRAQPEAELLPAEIDSVFILNRLLIEYLFPKLCPVCESCDIILTLHKVKDAALRADGIVKNLLKFARPTDSNRTVLSPEQMVEDAWFNIPPVEKQHVDYVTAFRENLLVRVDSNQLMQVLINIIINACHAIGRDRHDGRIVVRSYPEEKCIGKICHKMCVIEIEDNGVGIKKENLNRVFEPFFTTKIYDRVIGEQEKAANPSLKSNIGGSGLGLSVSKSIITNHGGDITLTSSEGQGTTVKIYLPCAA
jgi:signal transduction histidine kinase